MIIFGPISGGHFNPAITLGVMIKEMSLNGSSLSIILMTLAIIFSQILGGFIGVFISFLSISDTDDFKEIRITYLCSVLTDPAEYEHDPVELKLQYLCSFDEEEGFVNKRSKIFMVELICTLILVCVVLNLKYNEVYSFAKEGLMTPMAIGIIYFGMITMSISTSGACLNPAIGLVQSLYQKVIVNKYVDELKFQVSLQTMWIYIVAPSLGGLIAALL